MKYSIMKIIIKVLLLLFLFLITAILTIYLTRKQDTVQDWNHNSEELLQTIAFPFPIASCKWTKGTITQNRNDFPPGPSSSEKYIYGIANISPEILQKIKEEYTWEPYSSTQNITIKKIPGYNISSNYMISNELSEKLKNIRSYIKVTIILSNNHIYFHIVE